MVRKIKDFGYNYVDRVRLTDDTALQQQQHHHHHSGHPHQQHLNYNCKCLLRHAGWRHNRSVSHLDLATSCHHNTAYGLSHWSKAHPHHHHHHHHQLRHTRSLDYNFSNHNHNDNERYEDALDIAEYYWRIDPDEELYCDEQQQQQHQPIQQYKSTNHLDYVDDLNYHLKANNNNSINQQHQQQQQQQQQLLSAYDFVGESCSLRRSRSLAVIREETFSDLQITVANQGNNNETNNNSNNNNSSSTASDQTIAPSDTNNNNNNSSNNNNNSNTTNTSNNSATSITTTTTGNRSSRRSQLIPRARLVNRGYFRERERLICGNNRHHHRHYHHLNETHDELATLNSSASNNIIFNNNNNNNQQDIDNNSNPSTCDSHQRQHQQIQQQLLQQQQQQQQNQRDTHHQSRDKLTTTTTPLPSTGPTGGAVATTPTVASASAATADDYYENLKRLDELALAQSEHLHLHPWHNDKSDLESLNSDYFKNSLHQTHEQQQQQQAQHQHQAQHYHQHKHHEYELEALEKSAQLLSNEKTRIYQSRRTQQQQQRLHYSEQAYKHTTQAKLLAASTAAAATAAATDSCPENSQSSAFPETTTSNSDDQTDEDSPSLSEQEYDLSRIEEVFQQTLAHTGDDDNDDDNDDDEQDDECYEIISLTATHTHYAGNALDIAEEVTATAAIRSEPKPLTRVKSNQLRRAHSFRGNLDKLIAYDSVYLSSEESTDDTLAAEAADTFEKITADTHTDIEATASSLLHISIEDTIYEAVPLRDEQLPAQLTDEKPQIYTQILKVEQRVSQGASATITLPPTSTPNKPKILTVVEKRKLKRCSEDAAAHNDSSSTEADKLKRPATDTLYLASIKTNSIADNQYHSLPDINIGQSLKVSECIDAELRSSYNLIKYKQHEQAELIDCCAKRERSLSREQQQPARGDKKQRQRPDELVTKQEITDSIKRFGRAHQKARQRESKEFNELHAIGGKSTAAKEVEGSTQESAGGRVATQQAKQGNRATPVTAEETVTTSEGNNNNKLAIYVRCESFDAYEQPKEAPNIEGTDFNKQIERRSKEIKQGLKRQQQFGTTTTAIATKTTEGYSRDDRAQAQTVTVSAAATASQPFRIIVTDTQDNIIEEDSIEAAQEQHHAQHYTHTETQLTITATTTTATVTATGKSTGTAARASGRNQSGITRTASLKRVPSKLKRHWQNSEQPSAGSGKLINNSITPTETATTATTTKTGASAPNDAIKRKERRVLSTSICKAHPVLIESFRRNACGIKMSRPQVLHVVDNSRRETATGSNTSKRRDGAQVESEYLRKVDSMRCFWSKLAQKEQEQQKQQQQQQQQQEQELLQKQQQQQQQPAIEKSAPPEEQQQESEAVKANEQRPAVCQSQPPANTHKQFNTAASTTTMHDDNSYCSYMPSIEIVELAGEKATIVSAVDATACCNGSSNNNNNDTGTNCYNNGNNNSSNNSNNNNNTEPQFDHIRYKVLKSEQLVRKHSTILARSPKEAQFDGLIQYLQEYSFQELLSNNNVVIVEPVRTKIERPMEINGGGCNRYCGASKLTPTANGNAKPNAHAHVNGGSKPGNEAKAGKSNKSAVGGGIKRHFFYQPVRVNRELYEEELPVPNTVRDVRQMFEQNVRLQDTAQRQPAAAGQQEQQQPEQQQTATAPSKGQVETPTAEQQLSPRSRRARKYRYLTIDTSYGYASTATAASTQHQQRASAGTTAAARKWETASLSSGISSGDLSSPCDCTDHHDQQTLNASPAETTSVQQAIQQHNRHIEMNNNNSNARRVQPWHAACRTGSGNSNYRKIYEHNANKQLRASRSVTNVYEPDQRYLHDDDNDSNAAAECGNYHVADDNEDMDADDESGAAFYVNNDVLERIRQCGSTVTYYGGRVIQRSNTPEDVPEPQAPFQQQEQHAERCAPDLSNTQLSLTRQRAREIERHQQTDAAGLEQCQRRAANRAPRPMAKPQDLKKDNRYLGVAFKLIKSNSCSSRLELAGAADIETQANVAIEPVAVKQMINHFEHNTTSNNNKSNSNLKIDAAGGGGGVPTAAAASNLLTINNQMPVRKIDSVPSIGKHVTVNNHINMPQQQQQQQQPHPHPQPHEYIINGNANNNNNNDEHNAHNDNNECENTYQSAALNIHLRGGGHAEHGPRAKLEPHKGAELAPTNQLNVLSDEAATATIPKICRNKNVDLAFTMLKQQQQQQHQQHNNKNNDSLGQATNEGNEPAASNQSKFFLHQQKQQIKLPQQQQQQQQQQDKQPKRQRQQAAVENAWQQQNENATRDNNQHETSSSVNVSGIINALTAAQQQEQQQPQLKQTSATHHNGKHERNVSDDNNKMAALFMPQEQQHQQQETHLTPPNLQRQHNPPSNKSQAMPTAKAPAQIIVPVDIHAHTAVAHEHEQRLSSALSTTSLNSGGNQSAATAEKQVVQRHYVANDKSLFERRKYDEIEFEEFEVYDPTKDLEKLLDKQEQQQKRDRERRLHEDDEGAPQSGPMELQEQQTGITSETDCYDSLDDKF